MGMIEKKLHRLSTKQGGALAFDYLATVLADQVNFKSILNMISDKDLFVNPTLEFGTISDDSDIQWTLVRRVDLITKASETHANLLSRSVVVTTGLNLPIGCESVYTFCWDPGQPPSSSIRYTQKSGFDIEPQSIGYKPFAKAFAEVMQHANSRNYRVSFRQ